MAQTWLDASKITKKKAKNVENLKNKLRAPFRLVRIDILQNFMTFGLGYACKFSTNSKDIFCKLYFLDTALPIK